ncbi:MAG: WD40 repeat domain-containing protein [Nostoc sp.]
MLLQQRTSEKKQVDAIASGALVGTSEQLLEVGNQLEAMIASVRALKAFQDLSGNNADALNRLKLVMDKVQEHNRIEGHTKSVNGVSYSPKDPLLVSASDDKTLRLWKLDGTPVPTVKPMTHDEAVYTVNFSPNGQLIASASADKTVKLWKKDGTYITTLKGHEQAVTSVNFSPDSQTIISASYDGTIRLWQIETISPKVVIKKLTTLRINNNRNNNVVWYAEFSPNGQLIASADNESIKLWKKDGTLITNLTGHTAAVRYVPFGHDNKTIISTSEDRTIRIWKWQTDPKQIQPKVFTDKGDKSYIGKFSPNYKYIATANPDGTTNIWKASNGAIMDTLSRHKDEIFDLSFRPDGKEIATVSKDKTIKIWSLDFIEKNRNDPKNSNSYLIKRGCTWIADYLNNNQKDSRQYQDVKKVCREY